MIAFILSYDRSDMQFLSNNVSNRVKRSPNKATYPNCDHCPASEYEWFPTML